MKFSNTSVMNFENSFRGLRNPLESWRKNDTVEENGEVIIGENDLNLAQRTAPLYWWKEFDTYKVGTVANSTSTMHKLATTPITFECFELGDYDSSIICNQRIDCDNIEERPIFDGIEDLLCLLEGLRLKYLKTKDKRYWKELVRWLPESWLQTRTVTMSYENLLAMCSKGQRRFHKLTEWSESFIGYLLMR